MPNNPLYDLGPLAGSACDTLFVAVRDPDNEFSITLSPNPCFDKTLLNFKEIIREKITASVWDETGREVFSFSIKNKTTEINLEGYSKGIYFVRVSGEHFLKTFRLVKL